MNVSCVCGYCRRVVDYGEGLFDDEIWYHQRCYFTKLKKEVDKLEKKANNKSITLEEYEHLTEISCLLNNVRSSMKQPTVKLSDVLGSPQTPIFEGKSHGMKLINEHNYLMLDEATKQKQNNLQLNSDKKQYLIGGELINDD